MQTDGTRYYRVSTLAETFDVSPATIYRAIRAGQLDAVRIGGSVRVPAYAVAAFVEQRADDAGPSTGPWLEQCSQAGYETTAIAEVR